MDLPAFCTFVTEDCGRKFALAAHERHVIGPHFRRRYAVANHINSQQFVIQPLGNIRHKSCNLAWSTGKKDFPTVFKGLSDLDKDIPHIALGIFASSQRGTFLERLRPSVRHRKIRVHGCSINGTALREDNLCKSCEHTSALAFPQNIGITVPRRHHRYSLRTRRRLGRSPDEIADLFAQSTIGTTVQIYRRVHESQGIRHHRNRLMRTHSLTRRTSAAK